MTYLNTSIKIKSKGLVHTMKIVLMEPLGVSSKIIEDHAENLKTKGHEFIAYDTFSTDTEELIRRADHADVLMIANHPLSGEVIRSAESLKFISVAFVGIDHVDVEACKEKGIGISNTGGYCNDAVAELAVGLTLDCLRNITSCHAAVQSGEGKGTLAGNELARKTVGIIGTGAIGCRTAEIFKIFHCRLIGYNRSIRPQARELGIELMPLDEVMRQADVVSVHTPLTPDTKGLIGEREISLMKQGAVLINTSRGPVVDSQALADALKAGKIKAGIDVYEKDPPLAADHPLMGVPNLVCTPHVGFDTQESIERRAAMAFENVLTWLSGKPIRVML